MLYLQCIFAIIVYLIIDRLLHLLRSQSCPGRVQEINRRDLEVVLFVLLLLATFYYQP